MSKLTQEQKNIYSNIDNETRAINEIVVIKYSEGHPITLK